MKLFLLITCVSFLSFSRCISQENTLNVSGPNRKISYHVSIKEGRPVYWVTLNNQMAIDSSEIGLIVNSQHFGPGNHLQELDRKFVDQSYKTRGFHSLAINRYNSLLFEVKGGRNYQMEVRVFNDGLAFRYIVSNSGSAEINDDLSTFHIPGTSTLWSQSNIYTYEGEYKEQKIEEVKKGQIAGPPLTAQLPGEIGYISITEAGLTDFAGMSLIGNGNGAFKANLTGSPVVEGKIKTPWRVIIAGSSLNTLVNNDIVSNVSPAPDPKLFPKGINTDWIKPGKCVWSWLADNGKVTLENMKRFSDWASGLGIPYNLVDEGWANWQEGNKDYWAVMKELVDYSKKRGVKIWAWKAYPDRKGIPGIKDPVARTAFFSKCKAIGIAGLKIDFFDVENQEVIRFYQAALKDAAKFHLMLDFHGSNKPTGESRTWPNEMSREGIMGLENWSHWPVHNNTLIFTRFLAGHADYTPLTFSTDGGTTLTHQLATVAAFNSPFMCLGVNPEMLLKSQIKNMVKMIPVEWDETIVLKQSKIGKLTVMAKRRHDNWYLVVLNGEEARTIHIELNFLGKGAYQSTIFHDAVNDPRKTIATNAVYTAKDQITVRVANGGGFIGRFYKK